VVFETLSPSSSALTPARIVDPDEALVDAWVSTGDPAAFAGLVALHQGYVLRLALSVLGPGFEADAEDVAQEVFVRVAARLRDFRGDSRFRTWLHRLAVNLALDRRRRPRWRKPHLDASVLDNRPCDDRGSGPFDSAEAAERTRAVSECLEALPAGLRTVIHLRYWLDLTVEEIAEALQIPLGTVKSHLHRGRKLLFHAMQAKGLGREGARSCAARSAGLPSCSVARGRAPRRCLIQAGATGCATSPARPGC
jgi:RNA polymerase sigma-70 factor, ECF subfamily